MTTLTDGLADGWIIARRNVIRTRRAPDVLLLTLLQPIMFVLLFAYVFGGSIKVPGVNYREYLMAGIFVQTVAFGSSMTGAGLAADLQTGVMDRFRSMPMSRAAVLLGRTTSDLLGNLVTVLAMALCGLLVGWRTHTGLGQVAAGLGLLLLFAYAMSWISATIGLTVRSPEVAQTAGFLLLFPLTFVSNVFVAGDTLPSGLRPVADWNPISTVTLALRDLWGNAPAGPARGAGVPAEHPALVSLAWIAVILAVFLPLAVDRFRRAARR
ncbi:ABC transporter permease [Streptomyces mirabilis]|uniref:ABC transporter permease n=1 Tax=Streptomyces mirabilis TaxID=68239 RepID=UPI0033AE4741